MQLIVLRVFLIFISLLIFKAATYQPGSGNIPKYSALQAREDFAIFRKTLEEKHAGLYRYTSRAEMDRLFDSCYATLNDSISAPAFYALIKRILSASRDGHSFTNPSPALLSYSDNEEQFFPLKLYFQNHKAYVRASADTTVPAASELLSINHVPIDTIRQHLFCYIISDGYIESKKYRILNSSFPYYYNMVYGEQSSFTITFKTPEGMKKTRTVSATLQKELDQLTIDDYVQNDTLGSKNLSLQILPDSIALMVIQTFDNGQLDDSLHGFENFLKPAFTQLKGQGIRRLIIDLRGNGGGQATNGALLFSCLTDSGFYYCKYLEASTKNLPYARLQHNNSPFNDLKPSMLKKTGPRQYRLAPEAHPVLQLQKAYKDHFDGQVWFLIDGLSFSATAEFCAVVRSHERGKFIGEETGGGYYGDGTSSFEQLILPHTQVKIYLCSMIYVMDVRPLMPAGRGIIPDYTLQPGIQDVLTQKDVQLEYTLKLARE